MKDSILDVHLITGGTGSIGSALLRRLLDDTKHAKFRVLSRNDSSQHELRNSLSEESQKRVRFILADVRGKDIGRHMAGVSNVWHCAAIKHVVGANYNADECADINIMGTSNVLTAAHMEAHHNQKDVRFVLLSTDKAASPANIMGASKYCAEQIVLGAQWAGERLVRRVVQIGRAHV